MAKDIHEAVKGPKAKRHALINDIYEIEAKTINSIPKKIPAMTDSKSIIQIAMEFVRFDIAHLIEGEDMDSHAWATIGILSLLDDSDLIRHSDYTKLMRIVDKARAVGEKKPGADI